MKNQIQSKVLISVLSLMTLSFVACGGTALTDRTPAAVPAAVSSSSSNGWTTVTSTSTSTSTNTSTTTTPAITYSFTVKGTDSVSFSARTNSTLKVKINGGDGRVNIVNSSGGTVGGYNMQYGCARFTVTVGGRSVQTNILAIPGMNNSMCQGAPTEQVIDFSDRVGGTGSYSVVVSNAQYDWRCVNTGWQFCPAAPLYINTYTIPNTYHQISGNLAIAVDGTASF